MVAVGALLAVPVLMLMAMVVVMVVVAVVVRVLPGHLRRSGGRNRGHRAHSAQRVAWLAVTLGRLAWRRLPWAFDRSRGPPGCTSRED